MLIGTTNSKEFLTLDPTGYRRIWPVRVGKIDLLGLGKERDQLWGEAAYLETQATKREQAGEQPPDELLRLPQGLWAAAAVVQEERELSDPILERLSEKLEERNGTIDIEHVWQAAGFPPDRPELRTQAHRTRLGAAMNKLGFRYTRPSINGQRGHIYTRGDDDAARSVGLEFHNGAIREMRLFGDPGHRRPAEVVSLTPSPFRRPSGAA